jgi:glycosyltransferase involved in cell wall biosynthesis
MKKNNLHLTHTDIESDSRILKEMGALAVAGYAVSGLGVTLDEGSQRSTIAFSADISAIKLMSRQWTFLPRTLRHVASLFELVAKMLPNAIRKKPDIVHCHDTLVLPIGVIVKIITGARLVYDAHELESDRNGLSKLQGRLTLWVEKILWRFIDTLIVVSPSIQKWYCETLGPKKSTVILNAPLFLKNDDGGDNYLRDKFSIARGTKIFIYVGILGDGRGLDLITQAFIDENVSSHVVFLGYGDLSEDLKKLAEKHPNLHVHDAVPHSQVVPIVKSADFGLCLIQNVSLSDYYCLPNKLFEYCFAGVPVLASDFPDIRSVITEHGFGDCCNLDIDSIRKAVKDLECANKKFSFSDVASLSWDAQQTKLVNLYEQLNSSSSI